MRFKNDILAGTILARNDIQSEGFQSGIQGWIIRRDGTAEFQDIIARGDVTADRVDVNNNGVRVQIEPTLFDVGQFRSNILFPSGSVKETTPGQIFHEFEDANDEGGRFVIRPAGINPSTTMDDHIPQLQIRTSVTENPTFLFQSLDPNQAPLVFIEDGRLIVQRTGTGTLQMLSIQDFSDPVPLFDIGFSQPVGGDPWLHIEETDTHFDGPLLILGFVNSTPTVNPDGSAVTFGGAVQSASMRPIKAENNTNENVTTSSYVHGAQGVGFTFVAPPSGMVRIDLSYTLIIEPSTTALRRIFSGYEVREGGTVGSGSIVQGAEDNRSVQIGTDQPARIDLGAGYSDTLDNLTPGDTYNIRSMHRLNATGNIVRAVDDNRRIIVTPQP